MKEESVKNMEDAILNFLDASPIDEKDLFRTKPDPYRLFEDGNAAKRRAMRSLREKGKVVVIQDGEKTTYAKPESMLDLIKTIIERNLRNFFDVFKKPDDMVGIKERFESYRPHSFSSFLSYGTFKRGRWEIKTEDPWKYVEALKKSRDVDLGVEVVNFRKPENKNEKDTFKIKGNFKRERFKEPLVLESGYGAYLSAIAKKFETINYRTVFLNTSACAVVDVAYNDASINQLLGGLKNLYDGVPVEIPSEYHMLYPQIKKFFDEEVKKDDVKKHGTKLREKAISRKNEFVEYLQKRIYDIKII